MFTLVSILENPNQAAATLHRVPLPIPHQIKDYMRYQAVNTQTLRAMLGKECSPIGKCRYTGEAPGYVIGPDITGRVAHCATCRSMEEARRLAAQWNKV